MCRRQDFCVEMVRKNVWTATGGQVAVESLQVRETAAENDHLRIEQIDDAGQRAPEARLVTPQRRLATYIAGFGTIIDFGRR